MTQSSMCIMKTCYTMYFKLCPLLRLPNSHNNPSLSSPSPAHSIHIIANEDEIECSIYHNPFQCILLLSMQLSTWHPLELIHSSHAAVKHQKVVHNNVMCFNLKVFIKPCVQCICVAKSACTQI